MEQKLQGVCNGLNIVFRPVTFFILQTEWWSVQREDWCLSENCKEIFRPWWVPVWTFIVMQWFYCFNVDLFNCH